MNKKKPIKKTASKKIVKRKPSSKTTANGVKVGDRVRCEYDGIKFRTPGTAVAIIPIDGTTRVLVEHDYDVRRFLTGCWEEEGPLSETDSVYSIWGAKYVFKLA